MENFETILVKFNYEGVDYSYYVRGDVVIGDTDSWWDYWIDRNNYTFQIVGDMWGDTPIYGNLKVFVYPLGKYEDDDRIGEITKVYSKFAEEKSTKTFKDLKVGDTIYVTDRWDFYKLKIAEISIDNNDMDKCMKITFLDNCEFAYCDNALDIDSCFQIGKGYLEDFCIECYRDCVFFADKEECRDYLKTLQKRTGDALNKLDRCHYSWAYINDNGEEIKNEKVFDTMGECYREMRKIALSTLESLICNVTKTHDFSIHCSADHIKIIGINKRYDWFIVEV